MLYEGEESEKRDLEPSEDNMMAIRSEESIKMENQYLRQRALEYALQVKELDTVEDVTDAADIFLAYIKG